MLLPLKFAYPFLLIHTVPNPMRLTKITARTSNPRIAPKALPTASTTMVPRLAPVPWISVTLAWIAFAFVSIFVFAAPADAYSFAGKTVLVTGSAGGIGKAIAKALADGGAKVVVHYHTRASEARAFSEELGPERCLGVLHCDFRNISSIPSFFGRVRDLCAASNGDSDSDSDGKNKGKDNGSLDILVNNAGAITKLALQDDDDGLTVWQDTLAVNLHAPNLLGKLFAEQFAASDCPASAPTGATTTGVILNVGSIHGDRSNEYMGAYAASKAGLESLTRTQAIEYGPKGIRANLVAPGIVPVERTEAFFASHPQVLESWTERIPLDKAGTVEQVAAVSLAMIENDWVTGAVWQVDGGMMARANMPVRDRP